MMNRGGRHGAVFFNDDCRNRFLSLLGESVERYQIRVHAYVLMDNHYHLLVESVRGNLSASMRLISQEYTQYVNSTLHLDGSVFRGRFANKLVLDETHWHYLPVYLHMNPVRARLVNDLLKYKWSSHLAYSGQCTVPGWLTTSDLLGGFGGTVGYSQYLQEVKWGRTVQPENFDRVLFSERTKRVQVSAQPVREPALSVAQAIQDVALVTGTSIDVLVSPMRGRYGNGPRAVLVWWLVYGIGRSTTDVARELGMTPSAVSKVLSKWRHGDRQYKDNRLWLWKAQLEERKGQ
ncbi:MAG: transposase [Deltaproteobacteria bacterium]|nr:transposase [Deltaproteobacteria bacterium]